jgi:ribosomal protein S18 acetylase RimI-like enzyme
MEYIMVEKIDDLNVHSLYEYFKKISNDIPYYFPIDFDLWHKSMFNDCTEKNIPLFNELETYLLYEDGALNGFIQYGISSFIFGENGENYDKHYAIIRNLHYSKDSKNAVELLEVALKYFSSKNIQEVDAFFHYFGMSCYARHGKLHNSCFYIEDLLHKFSFIKEHENVYFSKDLSKSSFYNDFEIILETETPKKDNMDIKFIFNNKQIGCAQLLFLQNNICYLLYIEINNEYRRQGLGTKCMNNVCCLLKEKNIQKIDLDTIDSNYIAQSFYEKLGFDHKGITRSYFKK